MDKAFQEGTTIAAVLATVFATALATVLATTVVIAGILVMLLLTAAKVVLLGDGLAIEAVTTLPCKVGFASHSRFTNKLISGFVLTFVRVS